MIEKGETEACFHHLLQQSHWFLLKGFVGPQKLRAWHPCKSSGGSSAQHLEVSCVCVAELTMPNAAHLDAFWGRWWETPGLWGAVNEIP